MRKLLAWLLCAFFISVPAFAIDAVLDGNTLTVTARPADGTDYVDADLWYDSDVLQLETATIDGMPYFAINTKNPGRVTYAAASAYHEKNVALVMKFKVLAKENPYFKFVGDYGYLDGMQDFCTEVDDPVIVVHPPTVRKGKTCTLVANHTVKWKSSNKRIATVNVYGKVTAKKTGTVKITATDNNGKKTIVTIKVK